MPETIKWTFHQAVLYKEGEYKSDCAIELARLAEKYTDGRLILERFYRGDIYSTYRDAAVAVAAGEADLCFVPNTVYGPLGIPEIEITNVPYFGVDFATRLKHQRLMFEDPASGGVISKKFRENGVMWFDVTPISVVVLFIDRKAETMEELAKVKIRTPEMESWMLIGEATGCTVVPLPWAEVPMSLKTGVVGGVLTDKGSILQEKLYEMGADHFPSNMSPAGSWYSVYGSAKSWEKLPDDLKEIWIKRIIPHFNTFADEGNRAYLAQLDKILADNMVVYELPPETIEVIKSNIARLAHPNFEAINPEVFAACKKIFGF